eukprot:6460905-Amphidinium_carterae.1
MASTHVMHAKTLSILAFGQSWFDAVRMNALLRDKRVWTALCLRHWPSLASVCLASARSTSSLEHAASVTAGGKSGSAFGK